MESVRVRYNERFLFIIDLDGVEQWCFQITNEHHYIMKLLRTLQFIIELKYCPQYEYMQYDYVLTVNISIKENKKNI